MFVTDFHRTQDRCSEGISLSPPREIGHKIWEFSFRWVQLMIDSYDWTIEQTGQLLVLFHTVNDQLNALGVYLKILRGVYSKEAFNWKGRLFNKSTFILGCLI